MNKYHGGKKFYLFKVNVDARSPKKRRNGMHEMYNG